MVIDPISLIIGIIVFVCLFMVARWGMAKMGVDPIIYQVVIILLSVIFIVWLLQDLGLFHRLGVIKVGALIDSSFFAS